MQIYLCQHGQNEDNAEGILNGRRDRPLTDLGLRQAEEIAEKISQTGMEFDHIFTSPLVRAKATAQKIYEGLIGKGMHAPNPEIETLLIERDFGEMTGVDQSKIKELCSPDIIETSTVTYFLSPPGAETFPQLLLRGEQLLKKLTHEKSANEAARRRILLVAHGDIGKMIYAAYYKLDWKRVLNEFHFGNCDLLQLSEASPAEDTHVFTQQQCNT